MATTEEVLATGWRSPDIIRLMLYDAGSRQSSLLSRIFDRCVLVDNGYAGGPCLEWTGPCSGKPGRGRAKGRGHSYPRMNVGGFGHHHISRSYMKQLLADGHRLRVTRPTPGRVLEVSNTAMTFR